MTAKVNTAIIGFKRVDDGMEETFCFRPNRLGYTSEHMYIQTMNVIKFNRALFNLIIIYYSCNLISDHYHLRYYIDQLTPSQSDAHVSHSRPLYTYISSKCFYDIKYSNDIMYTSYVKIIMYLITKREKKKRLLSAVCVYLFTRNKTGSTIPVSDE